MQPITLYGAHWDEASRRAKLFLEEHGLEFTYRDVTGSQEAHYTVLRANQGKCLLPTLQLGHQFYSQPDQADLVRILGINANSQVVVFYGTNDCSDCRRAKHYLERHHQYYQFFNIEENQEAKEKVKALNSGERIIPTILIDGVPYTNPDNAQLKKLLSLSDTDHLETYDVIIIGGGPAGLTTAIYTRRGHYKTLLLERKNLGGNAFTTKKIKNYPAFKSISGPDLTDRMAAQVEQLGAVVHGGEPVKSISKQGDYFQVQTTLQTYKGRAVVLATGSKYRRLNIPGEEALIGEAVHFCSTCDGELYQGKEVLVIGGGRSALEEGSYLARTCKKVTIVHNEPSFDADDTYLEEAKGQDNITLLSNREPLEFVQENGQFKGLKVKHTDKDKEEVLEAAGAFIYVGMVPNTQAFRGLVEMDERGYIITQGEGKTSVEGIFAGGDCRKGALAQVAAAAGEGVLIHQGLRTYLGSK